MTAVDARTVGPTRPRARPTRKTAPELPYINRELSWLEYAGRVLFEARDERNPLLDRVNFLTIFASMLDEFFQVRISGLRQQLNSVSMSADGRTPTGQLVAARSKVLELIEELSGIYAEIRAELLAEGIEILDYHAIPEHHAALRQRFLDEIYPVLTPLAVDPGHPFP